MVKILYLEINPTIKEKIMKRIFLNIISIILLNRIKSCEQGLLDHIFYLNFIYTLQRSKKSLMQAEKKLVKIRNYY